MDDISHRRRLICPSKKRNPDLCRDATCAKGFMDIYGLRKHVKKMHQACDNCQETFSDPDTYRAHVRRQNCEWSDVQETKMEQLSRHQSGSDRERWEQIYGILFPNEEIPDDPYVRDMLNEYNDLLLQQLSIRIQENLNPQIILPPDLLTLATRTGVRDVYQNFLAGSKASSTSNSSTTPADNFGPIGIGRSSDHQSPTEAMDFSMNDVWPASTSSIPTVLPDLYSTPSMPSVDLTQQMSYYPNGSLSTTQFIHPTATPPMDNVQVNSPEVTHSRSSQQRDQGQRSRRRNGNSYS